MFLTFKLFQTIQFSSIWSIDRTLSDATTPQSGPGSNGNEGALCIPQSFRITEALQPYCLVSYPEHPLEILTPLQKWSLCIL